MSWLGDYHYRRLYNLTYSVVYCVAGTSIAVHGLTYDEAWTARDLHSVAGKTAWVEAEK